MNRLTTALLTILLVLLANACIAAPKASKKSDKPPIVKTSFQRDFDQSYRNYLKRTMLEPFERASDKKAKWYEKAKEFISDYIELVVNSKPPKKNDVKAKGLYCVLELGCTCAVPHVWTIHKLVYHCYAESACCFANSAGVRFFSAL